MVTWRMLRRGSYNYWLFERLQKTDMDAAVRLFREEPATVRLLLDHTTGQIVVACLDPNRVVRWIEADDRQPVGPSVSEDGTFVGPWARGKVVAQGPLGGFRNLRFWDVPTSDRAGGLGTTARTGQPGASSGPAAGAGGPPSPTPAPVPGRTRGPLPRAGDATKQPPRR